MVNSLSCAKVSHVNFADVNSAVNRPDVNATPITVSAGVDLPLNNQFATNNVMLSASNLASIPGNPSIGNSTSPGLHEDHDKSATVKMEVLDDLFGPGYGWETADNNIAASTAASTASAVFGSLLGTMSPISSSSSVATSKCTVKVPTESDFQTFTPQPPNLSAISLAAAAAMINEQPLRVVIPSPLPAGPDTTTATNSPIGVAVGGAKTPVMPTPTTPSNGDSRTAAASSSGKKTVFTAKGKENTYNKLPFYVIAQSCE